MKVVLYSVSVVHNFDHCVTIILLAEFAAVDEDAVLSEAKAIQVEAVTCYNNMQYAAAEAKFADVLEVMRLLYPATHPECIKAEKSVLMVQRKRAQMV